MKKQLFITALSGLLFTGAINMYGEDTPVVPAGSESSSQTTTVKKEEVSTTNVSETTGNKYSMPTIAQVRAWCGNHKLVLCGAAGVVGFFVLLKTSKSFRAFLGFEDEEEQDTKFVY